MLQSGKPVRRRTVLSLVVAMLAVVSGAAAAGAAAAPVIVVSMTASPGSLPEPGGLFTFSVRVSNTGTVPVTVTSLVDDIYGDLSTSCGSFVGSSIAPGGAVECPYSRHFTGTAGSRQTNIVTATGRASDGQTVAARASSTVVIGVGGVYTPVSPVRIEDTRLGSLGGAVGHGATVESQIAGRGGVPAGASAVVLNVSVTSPTATGYLTLYPSGSPLPLASNLNFTPGKTVPNLVVVKLGAGGRVAMYNSAGSTHVIFDVAGYYQPYADSFYGHFHPLVPARIADTRSSFGGVRLGPGQSFDLQVTGRGGAPASGVSAAVLNVAVTNTTAVSYLTIFPTGEARPVASNLNFAAGDTVSNRTMTKVGAGGRVTIYNDSGATDVVVDIGGTYSNLAGGGGVYTPVDPSRILDTRYTGIVPANGTVEVHVAGRAGVPAGARAVILNATVTGPAGVGYLTIFPTGAGRPGASDLNYAPGETRPNLVVVQIGVNGRVSLFSSVQSHVIFDVAGWFN